MTTGLLQNSPGEVSGTIVQSQRKVVEIKQRRNSRGIQSEHPSQSKKGFAERLAFPFYPPAALGKRRHLFPNGEGRGALAGLLIVPLLHPTSTGPAGGATPAAAGG